ncbi:MAG: methionyl-tRNA formyltransferase [Bacteroidetes bacterium]|nr:methionyl-tRNA formyltransferase [Bacteroidota bacterium]
MRIVFMGTPDFAVASLDILVQHNYNVVGVITAPDRKAGRGRQVSTSAVKNYALANGLNILQPTNLKHPDFLKELADLKADLQIVVAFRMLPEVVWSMPSKGTFNLHASLLPQYRGAAPINWAVINGEKETGVTTFFIDHKIDTGDLLFQEKVAIQPDETAGQLHDKLMTIGAALVLKTVRAIEQDNIHPIPQRQVTDSKHAPKLFKEDGLIDWTQTTEQIYNKIRGLSPYPAAYTYLNDKLLKIYETGFQHTIHNFIPGTIESDGKTYLRFYTVDGYIDLLQLQLEGKKRMVIEDFLRGNSIQT